MTRKVENEVVAHMFKCHSVDCLLSDRPHTSVYVFETNDVEYCASSLDKAAQMWAEDGKKCLVNVERIG